MLRNRESKLKGSYNISKTAKIVDSASLDFSGGLIIEDGVRIFEDVLILTHSHNLRNMEEVTPRPLLIKSNAIIAARAIILESVDYIGENSIIGAGAVVTKSVPDNQFWAGNPAVYIKNIDNS
ncbi:MAG: hypothetical protein RBR68_15695 [Tenuifilaceae bacterium]|nr:hypothetical protein [Tenuifilaceae bacterium]